MVAIWWVIFNVKKRSNNNKLRTMRKILCNTHNSFDILKRKFQDLYSVNNIYYVNSFYYNIYKLFVISVPIFKY